MEQFLGRQISKPDYIRHVFLDSALGPDTGEIRLWMPYHEKAGYWSCLIQISWQSNTHYSIATADDPIGALVSACYMIRALVDASKRSVYYRKQDHGGMPFWINPIISNEVNNRVTGLLKKFETSEIQKIEHQLGV
ncbi:DUF6968 family protein [Sphingomonas sp. Leaf343]|uniref:DUF6968 family protein n=1 Tax=Sphingomonas sp. Leaf343 TaxID=1736345 RepID=UPI0012E2B65A|nr:hypothetical protein [Sphingomonas sp. Leaf343]